MDEERHPSRAENQGPCLIFAMEINRFCYFDNDFLPDKRPLLNVQMRRFVLVKLEYFFILYHECTHIQGLNQLVLIQ